MFKSDIGHVSKKLDKTLYSYLATTCLIVKNLDIYFVLR